MELSISRFEPRAYINATVKPYAMAPDYLRVRLSEGEALSRAVISSCEKAENHNQEQNPYEPLTPPRVRTR